MMDVQSGRGLEPGAATVVPSRGPTWIEVNLDSVAHNLGAVKKLVGPKVAVMAVVKANAYGHGAPTVARTAIAAGASALGVTTVEEGAELRRAGLRAPILVMGAILPQEAAAVIRHSLTPSVGSLAVAQAIDDISRQMRRKTRVHVKVDTGLGRLGVKHTEAPEFVRRLREFDWIEIEGIYSHFATAFRDLVYARRQLTAFEQAVAKIEADGQKIPLKHMANSEAIITLPESRLNMVRVGNLMYGQSPAPLPPGMELRPTWSWKARVVHLQTVQPGGGVGYGRDYVARRETVVAVLPVGLADGFRVSHIRRPTRLSELGRVMARDVLAYLRRNRFPAEVVIRGRAAPVIGRVGMQTCTVDVTRIPGAEPGDVAALSARRVIVAEHIPRVYSGAQAVAGRPARAAGQEAGQRREEEARGPGGQGERRGERRDQGGRRERGEGRVRREVHERGEGRPEGFRDRGPREQREQRPLSEPRSPREQRPLSEPRQRRPQVEGEPREETAAAAPAAEHEVPPEPVRERQSEAQTTVLSGEKLSRLKSSGGAGAGAGEGAEQAGVASAKRPFGARKKKSLRGPKRRRHTPGKIRSS